MILMLRFVYAFTYVWAQPLIVDSRLLNCMAENKDFIILHSHPNTGVLASFVHGANIMFTSTDLASL